VQREVRIQPRVHPRVAKQEVQRVTALKGDAEIRTDETQRFYGIDERTRQLSDVFGVPCLERRRCSAEPAAFSFERRRWLRRV
jgi:hypothetical protein